MLDDSANTIEASHGDASEVATSPQPQTNFPLSPLVQLHFLFSQVIIQDGYESDAGVDHNVATNQEGPQEIDEIDIPQVGMMVLPQMVLTKHKTVIILLTSPC